MATGVVVGATFVDGTSNEASVVAVTGASGVSTTAGVVTALVAALSLVTAGCTSEVAAEAVDGALVVVAGVVLGMSKEVSVVATTGASGVFKFPAVVAALLVTALSVVTGSWVSEVATGVVAGSVAVVEVYWEASVVAGTDAAVVLSLFAALSVVTAGCSADVTDAALVNAVVVLGMSRDASVVAVTGASGVLKPPAVVAGLIETALSVETAGSSVETTDAVLVIGVVVALGRSRETTEVSVLGASRSSKTTDAAAVESDPPFSASTLRLRSKAEKRVTVVSDASMMPMSGRGSKSTTNLKRV